ncbi:MAG: ATP12 family protein [Pseudomonadota bacterium]
MTISPNPARRLAEAEKRELPKRFYKSADMAEVAGDDGGEAMFGLTLDGRPARTPAKNPLAVPSRGVAQALANEWDAQVDVIDPARMPFTKLANTIIDGIIGREQLVRDEIAAYAGSDVLCYRAAHPAGLVQMQKTAWDPILDWLAEAHDVRFVIQTGVMPVDQPAAALAAFGRAVAEHDAHALGALHVMMTLSGSAGLTLAIAAERISRDEAWRAAHVDEDWQISQWGRDEEADARRALRKAEFDAAADYLALHRGG